jgi:hypothetical protein
MRCGRRLLSAKRYNCTMRRGDTESVMGWRCPASSTTLRGGSMILAVTDSRSSSAKFFGRRSWRSYRHRPSRCCLISTT